MKSVSRFLPVQRAGLAVAALIAIAGILAFATTAVAQETTGRLTGTVTMKVDKSALPGVLVEAVHTPTGTRYSATTLSNGRYSILNVRVGGPYTVVAKLSGFKEQTVKGIEVALGEIRNVNLELDLATVTETVEVTATESPLINPDRMGSTQAVSEDQIKVLPTIRRQFQDLAKTNPYVNVASQDPTGTNISIGGKNNRYNQIQIDGAVNNDLFALGSTGTPGAFADVQPIALDAIQELQVVVSPYDVKQGGFTGGAINAITRGGSNEFRGSIYGSIRNENFVADKVPQAVGDARESPIASFDNDQLGARIGGPIIKDKLFFFLSGELNNNEQPTSGSADGSTSNSYTDQAQAAAFRQILITKYNYDPGSLGDYNLATESGLFFGRLDFNATTAHQMTLRHNYVDGTNDINANGRNAGTYSFETNKYTFSSTTNSTVFQINSVFGASSFNAGRVGYQTIRDVRQVPAAFPSVYICRTTNPNSLCSGNNTFSLLAGTERSSGANSLDQDILEVTDDFTLLKGNHTITIGTHNEFFDFSNLFIQDVFGTYYFNTLADLERGVANRYQVSFANGADPRRPTQFAVQQWGLYVGDQWRVNNNLTLNFGLRFDLPIFPDSPTYNPLVDTTFGVDTSQMPDNLLMISPRVGFNWSPSANQQIRGGVGVFAGRTPYVWISNNYGNTGIETTALNASNVTFVPDPNNPPRSFPPGTAAVQVNGIDPDFKFPQILRTTLAYDRELPFGIRMSIEGMFTKTLQDIFYQDINKIDTGVKSFYGGPTYKNKSTAFSNMLYLTNTDRGEQQNYSIQLDKRFDFGLSVNGSYTYTNSKAGFEGTSSVAYSNWRFYATNGDLYTEQLTRSQWEIRDRFSAVISQTLRTGPVTHNLGFVFTAQSGQPYSMMMGGNPNTDGETGNDLLYVPANYSDVVWTGTGAPTEAQWNDFVERNGLGKYRGRVAERNGLDTPWVQSLDFHYDVEVPISVIRAQFTFDVLNLINLLDSSAGLVRYVANYTYSPVSYVRMDSATGKPVYSVNSGALDPNRQYSTSDLRSRWQIKLGARLTY